MLTLTNRQVRDLLIRYHNLDGADRFRGIEGVRAVMDRLGTIQYDPLNVVGRNADLVLQARVRGYRPEMLQRLLYLDHWLVDGYDKEMCVYTARNFGDYAPQRRLHARDARNWLEGRGQGEAFEHARQQVQTRVKVNVKPSRSATKEETSAAARPIPEMSAAQMRQAVIMAEILKRPAERFAGRRWAAR